MELRRVGAAENSLNVSRFDGKKGWITQPQYLGWLNKVRGEVTRIPVEQGKRVVYYYGIGGGIPSGSFGAEKIDVISPLISTDFDVLHSHDSSGGSFGSFKREVTRDLDIIKGLRPSDIGFSASQYSFKATFPHEGRVRIVQVAYGKDARKEHPMELDSGYHVLYSRGIPVVFRDMDKTEREKLFKLLRPGGHVVLECFADLKSIPGFETLDMGDISWSGGRGLLVCRKPVAQV